MPTRIERTAYLGQGGGPLKISVLLPRGETYRNFVYSGVLFKLAQNCDLQVLAIRPNKKIFDDLKNEFENVHELRPVPRSWGLRFFDEILDMAHGRSLWTEAAKTRWKRQGSTTGGIQSLKIRFKQALAIIFSLPGAFRLLAGIHELLSLRYGTSSETMEVLQSFNPDLVFNASHSHSRNALGFLYASKRLGIPISTFLFSWDNLTSQGRVFPAYDYYYMAWAERIRRDLHLIYPKTKATCVRVTGTPQFDEHFDSSRFWSREHFLAQVGANPERPLILYSTGMSHHFPQERFFIERSAKLLLEMEDLGSPQLLVRLYGKEKNPELFDDLGSESPNIVMCPVRWEKNFQTPCPEDGELWVNALRHCDLGINIASTVSLELMMFDHPVVNIAFNPPGKDDRTPDYFTYYEFDHYRPLVQCGAVELARNDQELKALIRNALKNPSRLSSNRQSFLKDFFGETLDGKSSDRIAAALSDFASDAHSLQSRNSEL